MKNISEIKYEWVYKPANGISGTLEYPSEYGMLFFSHGRVVTKIDPNTSHWDVLYGDKLSAIVKSIIDGISLLEHKDISLDGPSRVDTSVDGKKHYHLSINETIHVSCSISSVELIVHDKNGNLVSNPVEERKQKAVEFSVLINKYKKNDDYINKMIASYYASIRDPKNELIHLYEIRDTISSIFASDKEAMKILNISKREWDVLGILANKEPLLEGRHRGDFKDGIEKRAATTSELLRARKSAVGLIEKYLNYLNQQEH